MFQFLNKIFVDEYVTIETSMVINNKKKREELRLNNLCAPRDILKYTSILINQPIKRQ
jgi:hypothetical protein